EFMPPYESDLRIKLEFHKMVCRLQQYRPALDAIAEALLRKQRLRGDEIIRIAKKSGWDSYRKNGQKTLKWPKPERSHAQMAPA
ncbi:hypothetical protein L9G74_21475, partial [Shewanella sp. C32]